ncbi:unnamed protein product [Ambrosiozyma monospora]|uniref:Unnamed protein product n=1 Tax=Ambrosiozyma monospora TaxID=43982 RepID=A0ACB5U7E1_AMBMO|nr:unnamed protein product [Ambrosiozyma monospora]
MSQAADIVEKDSKKSQEIQSTPSTHGSTAENFYEDHQQRKVAEAAAVVPEKPKSAYVFVGLLCLLVAFGGFVFGWDTGTISGFVNMSDFKRRFGQKHSDGTYYLSDVV